MHMTGCAPSDVCDFTPSLPLLASFFSSCLSNGLPQEPHLPTHQIPSISADLFRFPHRAASLLLDSMRSVDKRIVCRSFIQGRQTEETGKLCTRARTHTYTHTHTHTDTQSIPLPRVPSAQHSRAFPSTPAPLLPLLTSLTCRLSLSLSVGLPVCGMLFWGYG